MARELPAETFAEPMSPKFVVPSLPAKESKGGLTMTTLPLSPPSPGENMATPVVATVPQGAESELQRIEGEVCQHPSIPFYRRQPYRAPRQVWRERTPIAAVVGGIALLYGALRLGRVVLLKLM
jgi:hypothetical protein